MARGPDFQLTVIISANNTALKIEAARGFLQRLGRFHSLARREVPLAVAGKLSDEWLHQLIEGDGSRDRITG